MVRPLIALTIDEDGMALNRDKKVCHREAHYELATKKYGIRGVDLIFDALTLPLSTGQEEYRSAGMETLEAVKRIKHELADVKTDPGSQQYFLRARQLSAARAEQRLHARSGRQWPRYGYRTLY